VANDVSSRQWFVDTLGVIWTGNAKIIGIDFTNYAADADTCALTDINGKPVWSVNGKADLSPVKSGNIGWVNGLILTNLSAGNLIVYIK
jgi:hypothetical protein